MQNRKHIITTIVLALGFYALSHRAQGVVPPPPGGYPNFTTAAGDHALQALTMGVGNTALGTFSLFSVTTGSFNTAVGAGSLDLNTADSNTATGAAALLFNTTGRENTANGTAALELNETGVDNTANGAFALLSNTTGNDNTANGVQALFSNTTGGSNTAVGDHALFSNTTGGGNTAAGELALLSNTTGGGNTATGIQALAINTAGSDNTATGDRALASNIGNSNTATGAQALFSNTTGNFNTAVGNLALLNSTGTGNIALGYNAGSNLTSGDNNIYIGSLGVATESDTIRIGTSGVQTSAFIRGIRGVTTGNNDAVPVLIDSAGQLGTTSSSRRFKKEIKPMDSASEAILSLKPVTFHYRSDSKDTPQFGLIAEEVAAVNPDLVVHDENGEIYTVRYDAVNAMLLNEFLKEHKKVQEQQATIGQLKSNAAKQEAIISELKEDLQIVVARLKDQDSKIHRVSAELEIMKRLPQVVATNP